MVYYSVSDTSAIYHHGIKGMHWYIRRFQPYQKGDPAAGKGHYYPPAGSHKEESKRIQEFKSNEYDNSRTRSQRNLEKGYNKVVSKFDKDTAKGKNDGNKNELIKQLASSTQDPSGKIYIMAQNAKLFSAQELSKATADYAYSKAAEKVIGKRLAKSYQKAAKIDSQQTNVAGLMGLAAGLGVEAKVQKTFNKYNKAIAKYNLINPDSPIQFDLAARQYGNLGKRQANKIAEDKATKPAKEREVNRISKTEHNAETAEAIYRMSKSLGANTATQNDSANRAAAARVKAFNAIQSSRKASLQEYGNRRWGTGQQIIDEKKKKR